MKRLLPLFLLLLAALISITAILPGCDELVTKENNIYYYDTIRDSSCVAACHSDVNDEMPIAQHQWAYSGHAAGNLVDTMIGDNISSACGPQCHTTQGFVQSLSGDPDTIAYPLEIGCFACHAPHTTWNWLVRFTDQVNLINGETFNRSRSNICALCHQAATRTAEAIDQPMTDNSEVLLTIHWGPHGSQQADMLVGTGGYKHAGGEGVYINSWHGNAPAATCYKCHQSVAKGFTLGGHSFNLSHQGEEDTAACNVTGCHIGSHSPIEDFAEYIDNNHLQDFQDSIAILYDTLVSRSLLPLTEADTFIITDAGTAGAVYNYLFITKDKSNGLHNTSYSLGLIRESLNYLNSK